MREEITIRSDGGMEVLPRYEDTFKPESCSFRIVVVVLRSFSSGRAEVQT